MARRHSPEPDQSAAISALQAAVDTLRHELLVLGSETTANHHLLMEVERRVRLAAETSLSFTEQGRAAALAALLRPQRVVSHPKIRVGSPYDGGYVLLDDWTDIVGMISAGAGDNVEFEQAVAGFGAPVHLYDHTVDGLPEGVSDTSISFFREPFGPTGTDIEAALGRMPTGDLLLKLDTDGCEWDTLAGKADSLLRFRQIAVELHDLHRVGDAVWFEEAMAALTALCTHHVAVHAHPNNVGSYAIIGGVPMPDIIEMLFVRRDSFEIAPELPPEAAELYRPNEPKRPDYALGLFDVIPQ